MQQNMGLQSDGEADEFKRVLLEGNPILLVGFGPCQDPGGSYQTDLTQTDRQATHNQPSAHA